MTDVLSAAGVGTGKQSPTPIKWVGGKVSHVKYILPYWNKHSDKRLVELFAGGLGIAFSIKPDRVLANDLNYNLINFYRQMKQNPKLSMVMLNDEKYYYECREEFNSVIEKYGDSLRYLSSNVPRRQAELFYYLNRYCFNGLWRINSKGKFNVAFGHYPYSKGQTDLSGFFSGCDNWEFVSADFSAIILQPDDFVFADPPYQDTYDGYTEIGFGMNDQIRLCEYLKDHSGPQIIANKNNPQIISLYDSYGYEIVESKRPKSFRGKATLESKKEILAVKNMNSETRIP